MLKHLSQIKLSPADKNQTVHFHLKAQKASRSDIQFDLYAEDAMGLLVALQRYQAQHKLLIPDFLRSHGKPSLKIVTDDGEVV